MSKNKGRTSVLVDVEEFEAPAPVFDIATDDSPIIERAAFKSDLGYWWDCLAGLVLLQASLSLIVSGSKLLEQSDIALGLTVLLVAIAFAILTGRFAGKESGGRKVFGFVMVAAGLAFGIAGFALGGLPDSSPLIYAAIGLTIAGWSLRRLLGENVVRCLSLGLVVALPLLFLESASFIGAQFAVIRGYINYSVYWFVGVIADLNHVPFSQIDDGIKFAAGELQAIAAFGNVAGILVALALSIACSVVGRQSFASALLSALAAYMWWAIIRSGYCVHMATTKTLDGPLSELAMPIISLVGLFLLIIATNLCFGALMKAIEFDAGQFEVSPLTQIFNAIVSFPQLGPVPPIPVTETTKEEPLKKEDLILDEYMRAKEASQAAAGDSRLTRFSKENPNE